MQFEHLANERTALYLVHDVNGQLLYVGIGLNPMVRLNVHSMNAWWTQVARIDVKWFDTRVEAAAAESQIVAEQHPLFNVEFADRVRPNPEPIVVASDLGKYDYFTRDSVRQHFGVPLSVLKRCAEWGWLVPHKVTTPGTMRCRYLYSESAINEFQRRWTAGEYETAFPTSRWRPDTAT